MITDNEPTITYVQVGSGLTHYVRADSMVVKVPSSQTVDAYTVIEVTVEPQGGPPLLHKHAAHETFYVLQGDFEFWTLRNGRIEIIPAITGDVIHIPGGVPHNYKNAGTTVGKVLIVFSPGTMEGFFADMSKAQREGPLDQERMQPIMQKYGVELVLPPGEMKPQF